MKVFEHHLSKYLPFRLYNIFGMCWKMMLKRQ